MSVAFRRLARCSAKRQAQNRAVKAVLVKLLRATAKRDPFLGLEPTAMQQRAEGLFALLDTDANGIVDALEFLATLAMLSALEPADKVIFFGATHTPSSLNRDVGCFPYC